MIEVSAFKIMIKMGGQYITISNEAANVLYDKLGNILGRTQSPDTFHKNYTPVYGPFTTYPDTKVDPNYTITLNAGEVK